MDITTSKNSSIDLIELIQKNQFLRKIFPNGFGDEIFFGQISLDVNGRILLGVHIKTKPVIEVEKWGLWGDDYNVVVISLLGKTAGDVIVKNHHFLSYAPCFVKMKDKILEICQADRNFEINLSLEYLIFQGCDVYIDTPTD